MQYNASSPRETVAKLVENDTENHYKSKLLVTVYINNNNNNDISTREISIKKGIFQGDSLSPLWFYLALNPISNMLNKNKIGYALEHQNISTCISHLIYMDDIKLYSRTEHEMQILIDTTVGFSKDINMSFGFDKCKTIHILKGKIKPGDYIIDEQEKISAMEPHELYKYLGYHQSKTLDHIRLKNH